MSAKATSNRITLRIAVVYDTADALKQAKKLQGELDKQYDKTMSNRKNSMSNDINNQNKGIKEQLGLMGKWRKGITSVAEKMAQTAVFGTVIYGIIGTMRDAVNLAIQLDTAYTNLAIVSKMTATELIYVDEQVNTMTASLGRMKKEVIDSITEFSRAGYSIADSMTLAKNAIMGANVGAVGLDKVTTYLIAGLKSFKMEAEDSARILDVLFTVANITAIDLEGIGEAFLRSANTLKSAGATLEEATALLAAANESIQDPAKVGTALKTIASRLRGVGDEGEIIPTLAKDFEAVGIAIQNADGSFRNIYDVFKELSIVYNELDDLTRQSLLEKLAGKRQINIMIGLLENFDLAEKSLQAGIESAGSVALAQEKYLESLEGRMNLLKEGWNQFLSALTNTEGIKIVVSAITGLVKALTFLAETLPVVLGGITSVGIGLTAVVFPAFAPLLLTLAVATTGFGLFNQILIGTSGEAEKAAKAIAELDGKINELNSEIDKIKAIPKDERTEAQKEYLSLLEDELALQQRMRDSENTTIFQQNLKDAKKLRKEVEAIKNADKGLYGDNSKVVTQGDKITIDRLKAQEKELVKVRQARLLDLDSVKVGTPLYKLAQQALAENEEALKSLYSGYDELGVVYTNIFKKTTSLSGATDELVDGFYRLRTTINSDVEQYNALSDAIIAMTEDGYLSQEMLDDLLLKYPDIITATGLVASEMEKYAQAQGVTTRQSIANNIEMLKSEQKTLEAEVAIYKERVKLKNATMVDLYKANAVFRTSGVDLTNIENEIGILENSLKQFDKIDINRKKTLEEKPKKDPKKEKEIRTLTEREDKIRSLNNQIAMQQKIMARTEGTDAQIAANIKMIKLQEDLRLTLINQLAAIKDKNKALKKGQEGYEDYIDETMKLSLEIEETTSNIMTFSKAISDIKTARREDILKALGESAEELRGIIENLVKQELQDQINSYDELIKKAQEQLDIKLKEIEAEKELDDFTDDKLKKETELAKLASRMESLRVAASQGDVRAIAELAKLEEERAETQSELDELINNRTFENRKENLENQFKAYEDAQQKEIDMLEKNLNDASYIYQTTNDYMTSILQGNASTLYQSLIDWNKTYGTGFENDVVTKWENLIKLVGKFNSMTGGSLNSYDSANFGSATNKDLIIAQMKNNSAKWANASAEEKIRLHNENIALAKSIGYYFDKASGAYLSNKDKTRLYDNGGYKPKGVAGYMAEGVEEWVLKDGQIKAIQQMAISEMMAQKTPYFTNSSALGEVNVNIYGSITNENIDRITKATTDVVREVSQGQLDAFKSRGYKPNVRIR